MRKWTWIILLVLACGRPVLADEIILKNGKVIEGNLIKVDPESRTVYIDVVLSGELVGAVISYTPAEIQSLKQDGKYANLKKNAANPATLKAEEQRRQERIKASPGDIDARIRERAKADLEKKQETEPSSVITSKKSEKKSEKNPMYESVKTKAPPIDY